tara:strand:- start:177 stop:1475 length:1299 start_codon:yes stop_codon:yes gene_type:complete
MKIPLTNKTIKDYIHLVILAISLFSILIIFNFYNSYKKTEVLYFDKVLKNTYLNKTLETVVENLTPRYQIINYKVNEGDSIEKILNSLDISKEEKIIVLKNIFNNKKINRIFENQIISFRIDRKDPIRVVEINFKVSKTTNIIFKRVSLKDKFSEEKIEKNLRKDFAYRESIIKNSLYSSAIKEKIPPSLIVEFARIYGFQIDFQRDIWKNDMFQIIYESFFNDDNEAIETGNIIYANLILQGKEYPLYFFKGDQVNDYFDERGQSIKKTLMKTPINGARLSSSFGKRKHPILGFTKMHTGTDFAAPMGTPIMASGDGVVVKASWCGGGGNCVKIKHNSVYSTVYAHLSKFGRGIKKGTRVKQGQTIGYVGSTGMSTGPHLHYEVIENGRKVNSQKLKLPSGKTLKGNQRKEFEIIKIKTNVLKSELINKTS